MSLQGTLSITVRSREAEGDTFYARLGIPEAAAVAANFTPGMHIRATCVGNVITIVPDDKGRARFPSLASKARRHSFEQSARVLKLPLAPLKETPTDVSVSIRDGYGQIRMIVPHIAPPVVIRKQPTIIPDTVDYRGLPGIYGTAKTIGMEAMRYGHETTCLSLPEIIDLLRTHGRRVDVMGPRAFKLDGVSACVGDLVEAAVRASGDRSIALIMD